MGILGRHGVRPDLINEFSSQAGRLGRDERAVEGSKIPFRKLLKTRIGNATSRAYAKVQKYTQGGGGDAPHPAASGVKWGACK